MCHLARGWLSASDISSSRFPTLASLGSWYHTPRLNPCPVTFLSYHNLASITTLFDHCHLPTSLHIPLSSMTSYYLSSSVSKLPALTESCLCASLIRSQIWRQFRSTSILALYCEFNSPVCHLWAGFGYLIAYQYVGIEVKSPKKWMELLTTAARTFFSVQQLIAHPEPLVNG